MTHLRFNRIHALLATWCAMAAVTYGALAQQDGASTQPESETIKQPFLKVTEEKRKWIALEIAAREYEHPEGKGPKIALVGVAHIADRSFYRAVQKSLSEYDLVLYESVLPVGAKGAGGTTDKERVESTKAAMGFVAGVIDSHYRRKHRYPDDTKELRAFAAKRDARLGQWVSAALVDAWENELIYDFDEDDESVSLLSLGEDGKEGGDGVAGDLDLADFWAPEPFGAETSDDNIQAQLASALNLKYQLEALDYDQEDWVCSDMAMDEVDRALKERGVDFELVGGALAGTSFVAKMAKLFLGFLRFADAFFDGAIADTFKVLLIEMLGDEASMEMSMGQFGEGFNEVIVEMRNQVVIDDLKSIIENAGNEESPRVSSVAVLYGAAHMQDMARRLIDQLGYLPTQEIWNRAIEVDLEESVVSQRELMQIRMMVRNAMRSQSTPR